MRHDRTVTALIATVTGVALLLTSHGDAEAKRRKRAKRSKAKLQIIYNSPVGRPKQMDACEQPHCRALLERIQKAKKTIDFAIYGIRNQTEIAKALADAQKRGVRVRGVVDRDTNGKNYYTSTEELVASLGTVKSDFQNEKRIAAMKLPQRSEDFSDKCQRPAGFLGPLQCLGYDIGDKRCLMAAHAARSRDISAGSIMHHKFFVIDGRWLWFGSTNVSDSGTGGYNANVVAVVDDRDVASWYTREFEQMYVHDHYHEEKTPYAPNRKKLEPGVRIEVLMSPQNRPLTTGVRPILQKAKKRIDIAVFFLTHKRITRDLIEAHKRGVKVRIILDGTGATNEYSKHELLRAAGIPVKVEPFGGKMHMKTAAIDGETVIVGSMNWTSAGEGGNDENTMIIHSDEHAEAYHEMFDELWAAIPDRWLQGQPAPESLDSGTACFDGVDNDHDHKADGDDPSCAEDAPPAPPLPPWRIVPKAPGYSLVRGITDEEGRKRYYLPRSRNYDAPSQDGDTWFCSENDAKEAGYRGGW